MLVVGGCLLVCVLISVVLVTEGCLLVLVCVIIVKHWLLQDVSVSVCNVNCSLL